MQQSRQALKSLSLVVWFNQLGRSLDVVVVVAVAAAATATKEKR